MTENKNCFEIGDKVDCDGTVSLVEEIGYSYLAQEYLYGLSNGDWVYEGDLRPFSA